MVGKGPKFMPKFMVLLSSYEAIPQKLILYRFTRMASVSV